MILGMKGMTSLSEKQQMDTAGFVSEQSTIKRLNTAQLFADVKEVMIEHLNETYILRITKLNKLILTK